jgi:hypothetical protein
MTDIATITNHIQLALDRSLTQYKGKPKHEAFIEAFSQQVQDLEDAVFFMVDARVIDNAVGVQLDKMGEIVGLTRQGADDDFYRVLLYVKIGQNTSQGNPEKVTNIYKLLTGATLAHYINLNNGSVMLGANVGIPEDSVSFVYRNMELVIAGGVRIDHMVCFDATDPFAFAGPNTDAPGEGWSDITNTQGGKFAALHRNKIPFSFAGNDAESRGFGSLKDPVAGGVFVGIGGV